MQTSKSPRTQLEKTMVDMQKAAPGHWDFMFLNDTGNPYVEAVVGLNPLANGYSNCAPMGSNYA